MSSLSSTAYGAAFLRAVVTFVGAGQFKENGTFHIRDLLGICSIPKSKVKSL